MGPGPRFEPESQDPQSRRMTAYPTPAYEYPNRIKTKNKRLCGSRDSNPGRPASTGPKPVSFGRSDTPADKRGKEIPKKSFKYKKCSDRDSNPSLRLERPKWLAGLHHRSKKYECNKTRLYNGPNGIRTHDIPVMSRALYLAKLWAQKRRRQGSNLWPIG